MKKSFLIFLITVCIPSCFVSLLHAGNGSLTGTEPYLQNPTDDSVTIMWHTEKPAYGWIEYGKTDAFGEKTDTVIDGLRSANTTLHKIRITGLEPGSTYYYRACSKPIVSFAPYEVIFDDVVFSGTYTFKTFPPPASKISCVIFNDLHNNYALYDSLCGALGDTDYQFSIFNGDCFSDPQSGNAVLEALTKYNKGISAFSRPPVFIRGNHESRGAYARDLKKNFDYPGDEFFFAMTAGPIRFVFLDCGEDKTDDHAEYSGLTDFSGYRERQKKWLSGEIKSDAFRNASFRILVHHIPLYNLKDRGISRFSRTLWAPVLDEAQIDLAISGHVHRYGFVPAGAAGNNYPALIGGGSKNGTVMVLTAEGEQLGIKVLNEGGEIIGTFEKIGDNELKATSNSGI
ncbi:metallophosphoesterase [Candidatus Latescibacterota bacterium]